VESLTLDPTARKKEGRKRCGDPGEKERRGTGDGVRVRGTEGKEGRKSGA